MSDFERTETLRNSVVAGTEVSRSRLYKKHPTECASAGAPGCEGKAYLIPGDRVEVAGTCGGYARVRYVGKSRTFTGWIQADALRNEQSASADPSQSDILSQLEGYYAAPGRSCTTFDGNKQVPCQPPSTDCLRIRKVDDRHAKFDVYSVQRNGSQCEVAGVAEIRGQTLKYVDRSKDVLAHGTGLIIHFDNARITFEFVPGPNAVQGMDSFCGAGASLANVEFPLQNKEPLDAGTCGDLQNF